MKKSKKLALKKVTLRDLDEPTLHGMVGGATSTCAGDKTCPVKTCVTCESCATCHAGATCCEAKCVCTGIICS